MRPALGANGVLYLPLPACGERAGVRGTARIALTSEIRSLPSLDQTLRSNAPH
jgi:hypothetical protein